MGLAYLDLALLYKILLPNDCYLAMFSCAFYFLFLFLLVVYMFEVFVLIFIFIFR